MSAKRRLQLDRQARVERPGEEQAPAAQTPRRGRAERILAVSVAQIFPDPAQPRAPLLPLEVRQAFVSGEIDQFEAAARWVKAAQNDPAHERRIQMLRDMGYGYAHEEVGQINPVSVVEAERGTYLIETGEQRYWAAVLQFIEDKQAEAPPLLKVKFVDQLSPTRQVVENRHFGPPSAISQAREVATLFISEGHLHPPAALFSGPVWEQDPYALHRWVAAQRKPKGVWKEIEALMGTGRSKLRRLLNLLQLPTDLLQIADRNELPERLLREIIDQQPDDWADLIAMAVAEGWSYEEQQAVLEAQDRRSKGVKQAQSRKKPTTQKQAVRAFKRFATHMLYTRTNKRAYGEILDEIATHDRAHVALDNLRNMVLQLELRLENMEK